MARESLSITNNRTGKSYEIAIRYGTYPTYGAAIDASSLRQIKVSDQDFGLLSYDPGFTNTVFPVLFAIPRTAGWLAQWQDARTLPASERTSPEAAKGGSER